MIEKMTKYSFVLSDSEKDNFLERLQALGLVDITRSEKPVDARTSGLLDSIEKQKRIISEIEAGADPTLKELDSVAASLRASAQAMAVWGDWDRDKLSRLGITLHFYSVSSKKYDPQWEATYAIQKVADDGKTTWFVIAGDNSSFPLKELPAPQKRLRDANAEADTAEAAAKAYRTQLEARRSELPALGAILGSTQTELSLALASASAKSAVEQKIAIFEGYAPVDNDSELEKAFDAMDGVVWFKDAATLEDNPPIEFRNNRFVRMFETITDMYGRPAYDGFDPTPFIAVFFMLFFAFCMGDAGYGLLLVAMGLGLRKMLGSLAPLVTTLGVATTVVGFIFHTFFSMDIAGWSVFAPIKWIFLPDKIMGYDGTMVLAIIIGIIHLCLAMCIKTYIATRNNGFKESLGVWGWTLLIVGGVVLGSFALIGVLDKEVTKIALIALGCLSAVGIFLLNDIHRNPLLNIGSGLWETYNTVTGLLGDVLSYLRLYALGLAGAMLGKAFNDIGTMVLGDGSNIAMWLPFILIVVIGHTLNIAMAALGAFVHPLRLNFLEFFKNSGYEAAGRRFNPLKK